MEVYRGGNDSSFSEHKKVADIGAKDLEDAIDKGKSIRFGINVDENSERKAVGTVRFEDKDIIPIMKGVISSLSSQQTAFLKIEKIVLNNTLDSENKIKQIQKAISEFRNKWV